MAEEKGKKEKIVDADWLANDRVSVELKADEKDNPRLKINVPANKLFIELTETDPPFVIVVARADNPIASKGALAQAHDMILLMEHKINKAAALSLGVAEAASKPLTKEAIAKKLAEGVH